MTHQSISSAARRAAASGYCRLLIGALACLAMASACISDVELPPCVVSDTCGQAGLGGSSQAGSGAAQAGVGEPGGGAPTGNGGAASSGTGSVIGGGEGGTGAGGDAAAGEGGAGSGPPCCRVRPLQLPAGCQGQPYRTTIFAEMGEAPYQWQLTPPAPGWLVASEGPSSASLRADTIAPGNTKVTVTVTDAKGRRAATTLQLLSRASCWLAYLSQEKPQANLPEQGQLHLVDPIDGRSITPQHNDSVADFQFSPDGKHLVYSHGKAPSSPRGQHLALIDITSQTEQPLGFDEDAIHGFAWSPNSSLLAVAFAAQGVGKLGAVRLTAATLERSPVSLAPIAAHVEEGLAWAGNDLLVYHAELLPKFPFDGTFVANPQRLRTAFYSRLGAAGLAPEVPLDGALSPNAKLRVTDAGFYMISDGVPGTNFYATGDDVGFSQGHDDIALLSPSGKYSAALFDGAPLALQAAQRGSVPPAAAEAREEDTCDLALAWARGAERVACVSNVRNPSGSFHGEVHLFDLTKSGDQLHMLSVEGYCEDDTSLPGAASCLESGELRYSYGIDAARESARAFSPSGRWFVFTRRVESRSYVYVAEVDATSAKLVRKLAVPAAVGDVGQVTSLSFSQDERLLSVQLGRRLMLFEVAGARDSYLVTDSLGVGELCAEEFARSPDDYCGSTEQRAPIRWAPDSASFAFRTPNALTIWDVTSREPGVYARVVPKCDEACRFEFQPL